MPIRRGQVKLLHFADGQAKHMNSRVKIKTNKNMHSNNFESLFPVWFLRITVFFFSSSEAVIFNRIFLYSLLEMVSIMEKPSHYLLLKSQAHF